VLVRPGAIGLPVLLGVAAALREPRRGPAYHRQVAAAGRDHDAPADARRAAPWAMRNHRVVGAWVWTSTNGGITRYDGFNPDATGASDQSFVAAMPQLRR
jgi:hypothetical protein